MTPPLSTYASNKETVIPPPAIHPPSSVASKGKFFKTKLCPWQVSGVCRQGNKCTWAHQVHEVRGSIDLTKTRLCPSLHGGRPCTPGCRYAHSRGELRATSDVFKTTLCGFWMKGGCFVGPRCRYAHGLNDLRTLSARQVPVVLHPSEQTPTTDAPSVRSTPSRSNATSTSEGSLQWSKANEGAIASALIVNRRRRKTTERTKSPASFSNRVEALGRSSELAVSANASGGEDDQLIVVARLLKELVGHHETAQRNPLPIADVQKLVDDALMHRARPSELPIKSFSQSLEESAATSKTPDSPRFGLSDTESLTAATCNSSDDRVPPGPIVGVADLQVLAEAVANHPDESLNFQLRDPAWTQVEDALELSRRLGCLVEPSAASDTILRLEQLKRISALAASAAIHTAHALHQSIDRILVDLHSDNYEETDLISAKQLSVDRSVLQLVRTKAAYLQTTQEDEKNNRSEKGFATSLPTAASTGDGPHLDSSADSGPTFFENHLDEIRSLGQRTGADCGSTPKYSASEASIDQLSLPPCRPELLPPPSVGGGLEPTALKLQMLRAWDQLALHGMSSSC